MFTVNESHYTVKANNSKRTLTIREFINGKLVSKYRSIRLDKDEFHYYSNFATQRDIRQFLHSSDYYRIK